MVFHYVSFEKYLALQSTCFLIIYNFISSEAWHETWIRLLAFPYKHTTRLPRWNDVKTIVFTSFQREIHVMYL